LKITIAVEGQTLIGAPRHGGIWIVRRNDDMFLNFSMLIQAIVFALGIWWCMEIFPRWRDDIRKFRQPDDRADRWVIIILWSITAGVLFLCIRFGLSIVTSIVRGIQELR